MTEDATIPTPDVTETHLGTLSFEDGAPSSETVKTVRDHLDHVKALDGFISSHRGASVAALQKGLRDVGVEDNDVIIYSELMDTNSLFLTGNADTVFEYASAEPDTEQPALTEATSDSAGSV